jgi:hypothetical protein
MPIDTGYFHGEHICKTGSCGNHERKDGGSGEQRGIKEMEKDCGQIRYPLVNIQKL